MPQMICVKCEREFRPRDNGVLFLDMAYDPPIPMKSASADIWECPGCRQEIVSGMSIGNHDQDRIKHEIESAKETGRRVIRSFENASAKSRYYENRINE